MSIGARQWTRRQFSQTLATSVGLSLVDRSMLASSQHEPVGVAFVGSKDAIHVFRVKGSRWRAMQTLAAAAPIHLEFHPELPVLYAVHGVALWQNLPRGAVSAYRIAPESGELTLLGTQPISLSATCPRHATISPDGRHMLVSAEQGGIYNLLPIAADGGVGQTVAIRKEHGRLIGKTAAPCHAVFHPDGRTVFAADAGLECVTAFRPDEDGVALLHRASSHAGTGPSQIALAGSGEYVYALHATEGSVAVHRFSDGQLSAALQIYRAHPPGAAVMAMHPEGRFLVVAGAGAVTSLGVASAGGRLASVAPPVRCPLLSLAFTRCGTALLGAAITSGEVVRMPFDGVTGTIGGPEIVARVEGALPVVFREALR